MPRRAGRHGQDEPQRRGRPRGVRLAPRQAQRRRDPGPPPAPRTSARALARTHAQSGPLARRGGWESPECFTADCFRPPALPLSLRGKRPTDFCVCAHGACARSRARACTHTCRRSASKRGCKRCGRTGASVHLLHVVHRTCDAACDVGRMSHSAQRTQVRDHSQGLREGLQDQREEVGQRLRVLPLSCRAAFGRPARGYSKGSPRGLGTRLGGRCVHGPACEEARRGSGRTSRWPAAVRERQRPWRCHGDALGLPIGAVHLDVCFVFSSQCYLAEALMIPHIQVPSGDGGLFKGHFPGPGHHPQWHHRSMCAPVWPQHAPSQ